MKFDYCKEKISTNLKKKYLESIITEFNKPLLERFIDVIVENVDSLFYKKEVAYIKSMLKLLSAVVASKNIDDDPGLAEELSTKLSEPLIARGESVNHLPGLSQSLVFLAHVLRKHGDQFKELFDGFNESKIELHMNIMAVILEKHLAQIKVDLESAKKNEMLKKVGRPFIFHKYAKPSESEVSGENKSVIFDKNNST